MNRKDRNRQVGFTLIELLVVVSIIALLVSILIPALANAKKQATGAVCLSNQKSLTQAWYMYAQENDDKIVNGHVHRSASFQRKLFWVEPPQDEAGNYTGDPFPTPFEDKLRGIERGRLYPYINNVDAYHCPGDKLEIRENNSYRSYGLPGGLNGEEAYWLANNRQVIKKLTRIKRPAGKYTFLEETDSRGWNMGSWVVRITGINWIDPLAIWHNEASTMSFADGHAEMRYWEDERTIDYFSWEGSGSGHSFNPDLIFMQKGYAIGNPL